MKKVMVIAVHPDDETLGCGGTILKHISLGDTVSVVFITNGNKIQEKIIERVSEAYSLSKTYKLGLKEVYLENEPLVNIIKPLS